jgi:alpha-glucosidase (family GH31 glycosyl hydrolase)
MSVIGVIAVLAAGMGVQGLAAEDPGANVGAVLLSSDALEVRATAKDGGYVLVEKPTGKVVVQETGLELVVAGAVAPGRMERWKPVAGGKLVGECAGVEGATVTLRFTAPKVLRVDIKGPATCTKIGESFADQDEEYFGLHSAAGGHRGLSLRATNWMPLLGNRGGPPSKYNSTKAPFFITNRGYGIYVDSVRLGSFAFNKSVKFAFEDTAELTYYVLCGSGNAEVMHGFNAVAGSAFMPPDWAFSTIWWRDNPTQKDLEADLDDMRRLQIPVGAMWIDRPWTSDGWGWGGTNFGAGSFPDPAGMIKKMEAQNVKLMVWVANRLNNALSGMTTNGLGAPTPSGSGPSAAADMRKPEAVRAVQDYLDPFVKAGVRGYKIDRGDEGEVPNSIQSENAYLYAKAVAEGMEKVAGKDYFIIQRCAYDKSRQYAAVWNGDTHGPGMGGSIAHGLRAGIINFPMWGTDTGGYQGAAPGQDEPVKQRWLAFSCYSPIFEVILERFDLRKPADDPTLVIMRKFANRHHELLPYSRSCMQANTRTGMPIMRPVFFEFAEDQLPLPVTDNTWAAQYLYGPSLLVAPVTADSNSVVKVALPAGQWLDGNDLKTVHAGPKTVDVPAPMDVIPVFIREGAILPVGDILQVNNNWTANWKPHLRVEVYPGKAASRFEYYTGKKVVPMTCANDGSAITVAFDDPGVAGEVVVFCSAPKTGTLNGTPLAAKTGYTYDAGTQRLTVPFQGGVKLELAGAGSLFVAEAPAAVKK